MISTLKLMCNMITFESIKSIDILDETPLGEGAFSFVYKVRHRDDGKIYAMKKIDILNLSKADCENLKLEIQLHQDLFHENIIKFHGCIQRKNIVYMLLENAANGSLFFYIDIKEGLPELLALRFFYETALGIKYLHDLNIVHRDIKPENILLDKDFRIKVCDFGWSCKIEGDDVRSSICGTYEYMSPEIVNEESHDYGVDIWCLGILLFEMLHGNPPFNAENLQDIKKEFQKKKIMVDPKYDKDTIDLIDQLLRYNSEDRISIEDALNHRAIKKNLKHITRKLTQEEYNLLTRYYYMNSGGNQLTTHNSTYARQLKRQSMLTKVSHSSYKSTDSGFFTKPNSKVNPSDFVTNDTPFQTRENDPLKIVHHPENFKNDFIPNSFKNQNVINIDNNNNFANSAFKKKLENVRVDEDVLPSSNQNNKVSEQDFGVFSKDQGIPNKVHMGVMQENHKATQLNLNNEDKNLQYKNVHKPRNNDGNKNKAGKNTSNNKNKNKSKKKESGVKPKQITKKTSHNKLTIINDPLKIANENLIKRNISKSPKGHTTLEEFQKKYNPEKFKQKFQKNQNTSKSPVTQKQISQPTLISKTKNTSPITTYTHQRMNSQGNQIRSAKTPIMNSRAKDIGTNIQGVQNVRTISKSPSTGNFNVGRTKFTNLRDAIKSNQGQGKVNQVISGNSQNGKEENSGNTRTKVVGNVTSISQHPASIFTNLQTKHKNSNNYVKGSIDYKSSNIPSNSQRNNSFSKNYKSNINSGKTTTTTTTQIRKHLVRTEVQKVRATGMDPNRFAGSSQEKNRLSNLTANNVNVTTNAKNLNNILTVKKGNTITTTTRRHQTITPNTARTTQNDALNQTAYIVNTYEDHEIDQIEQRYSLGVRSRTVELRSTEPRHKVLEPITLDIQKPKILMNENKNNKTKLSKIFEEPSTIKTQDKSKPNSLFQHLKGDNHNHRYVNIKDIEDRLDTRNQEKQNIRSKSSDISFKHESNKVRGKFNKRVVYVNGKKTEKFIYSKSNNKTNQNNKPQEPPKSINTFDFTNERLSEPTKISTSFSKSPISKSPHTQTPNINKSPDIVSLPKDNKKSENEEKNSKDDKNKKKYKIVTVPKVNARVHQEGGLKFSNIKPITVIQQGTFALSRTKPSNDIKNVNNTSMTIADEKKSSSRFINANNTSRNASISAVKKSVDRVEILKKEGEDQNLKGKRETSANIKRVISYQEYKRRIQKSLQKKEDEKNNSKNGQKSIPPEDKSKDPKSGLENNVPNGISIKNNPLDNKTQNVIKTTTMKPSLNPYHPPQPESTIITLQPPKDNIDTLVRKLEKMNKTNQSRILTKNKTADPISLNTLIHQVNNETKVFQNENQTERTRALTKPIINKSTTPIGHKKNKTMFNINEAYINKTAEYSRTKSGSSYNNYIPQRDSLIIKANPPQKKGLKQEDIHFFGGGYSKSSQRNYTTRNEVNQIKNTNGILNRPQSSRVENSKPNGNITTSNNIRVYANVNQKQVGIIGNTYQSNSRRYLHESERNSKKRTGWQNVVKTTGTIKQSSSVKRLEHQTRTTSLQRNQQVFHTQTNRHAGNMYVFKHPGQGNVTTTIRRYTVNPSPKKGGERFKSPTGGNTNRTNYPNQMGPQKQQIFSDLSQLKKNLKTTTYYQNN